MHSHEYAPIGDQCFPLTPRLEWQRI